MFECAYLEKRIIVACQVEHQIINAENLKQFTKLTNLGIVDKDHIANLKLIDDCISEGLVCNGNFANLKNGKYRIRDLIISLLLEK